MKIWPFILLLLLCSDFSHGQSQFFESFDGTRIAYIDEGQGVPVILIHGFISNGSSWYHTDLKAKLLAEGYRVIIPDLRGNGHSDIPQSPEAYKNDAEIKDLIKLADRLGFQKYHAVGYSRGSIVLAKLLTQETRIQKAVIGGMGLDFTNPDWPRRIMFAKGFAGKVDQYPETKGAVDYAKSIGADLRALSLLQQFQPVTSIAALGKIEIPVLIIAGDQDIDNGNPKELQEAIPNSRLTIIPGDHNGAYKTLLFAEKILYFLE